MIKIKIKDGEVGNRAYLFGESVFSTIRVYRGRLLFFEHHLKRLLRGSHFLWPQLRGVEESILALIDKNPLPFENGRLRITLSLNQDCPQIFPATGRFCLYLEGYELLQLLDSPDPISLSYAQRGKTPTLKPSFLKVGNYFDAICEKKQTKGEDVLFLDHEDNLAETTISNIFCFDGAKILTPPCSSMVLEGITRKVLIDLCEREKFSVEEKAINVKELPQMKCVWLTNSISLLQEVQRIDEIFFEEHSLPKKLSKLLWKEAKNNSSR